MVDLVATGVRGRGVWTHTGLLLPRFHVDLLLMVCKRGWAVGRQFWCFRPWFDDAPEARGPEGTQHE